MHPAAIEPDELLKRCTIKRGRASGPGGQHRNKVETAVSITHAPTGVEGYAAERRSQEANRKTALFRLRLKLAIEHREDLPRFYQPSALWRSRCHDGKVAVNEAHADFPALIAEALDVLDYEKYHPSDAAQTLGCTTSQLIKLLKKEPAALQKVNRARAARGDGPLR